MKAARRDDVDDDDHRLRKRMTRSIIEPAGTETHGDGKQIDYIPVWLLSELLCRLSVKDVFRFNCVSKQWNLCISDPSFRNLFLSRRASGLRCPLVFFHSKVQLVDEEDPKPYLTRPERLETENIPQIRKLTLPSLRERSVDGTFSIRAADKGFLLLEREERFFAKYNVEFYICNAVTKQWFTLPSHRFFTTEFNVGFVTQIESGVLTGYKVVVVRCGCLVELDVQMFSSETGRWENFKVPCEEGSFGFPHCQRPVVVNNTVCWMVRVGERGGILAYDPYASPDNPNRFRLIDCPIDMDDMGFRISSETDVHQGRLKYFALSFDINLRSYALKIWELTDTYQWRLQHALRTGDVDDSCHAVLLQSRMLFISFHPYDPDVLFLFCVMRKRLVSYNMKTRRMESLSDWSCEFNTGGATGFFQMLPIWPISVPSSLMFGC
ncbi:OLC1v1022035C1 [Oldenlandia corymbosa var. corymbosa]|uniref:OLC1v1022035C1 n=1 Tax=Oldenlandia corymbosa var. corymbosa TaxID=529605 RepID=A0AAV1BWZ5_OLDCO|nr:OLC1v1022035C1 [Oldenlandia corymbosa var. corymbosa]